MKKALLGLLFMTGMMFLFFTHPQLVMNLFGIVFILFLAVFVFAFYASYRQKSGKPIKGVTVSQGGPAPFVGVQGQGILLSTSSQGDTLRIFLSSMDYALILVSCFIFGPGMVALCIFRSPGMGTPWFVYILLACIVLLCTWLFFYYLRVVMVSKPIIEVTPDAIRLLRGKAEEAIFRKGDIERFEITTSTFHDSDSNTQTMNYILNVVSHGALHALCITDKKGTCEGFKWDMERLLNIASA